MSTLKLGVFVLLGWFWFLRQSPPHPIGGTKDRTQNLRPEFYHSATSKPPLTPPLPKTLAGTQHLPVLRSKTSSESESNFGGPLWKGENTNPQAAVHLDFSFGEIASKMW